MFFIELLCLITLIFYLFMGAYAIQLNPGSAINRIFLLITLIFASWSGAAFFRNLIDTYEAIFLWRSISLFTWSIGSCAILHFCLALTREKSEEHFHKADFYIYVPGLILFSYQFLQFQKMAHNNTFTLNFITRVGSHLFYLLYILASFIVLIIWTKKSIFKRAKVLSQLIIFSLLGTTVSILVYGTLFSEVVDYVLPFITPVFPVFWISAMWIAITKYRLMKFRPDIATYEIMDNVHEIIVLTDPDGSIIEVNSRIKTMLGYDKEELIGRKFITLAQHDDIIPSSFNSSYSGEINLKTRGNSVLPVRLLVTPVEDKSSETVGYVYSAQDLTLEKQYQQLSYTDKLTQVCNRLKLDEILEQELSRSIRYNSTFSVLIMDIDHFKEVNDTHGHQRGDSVLVELSALVRNELRESDTFGRWGGEEFLAVFPNTDGDAAYHIAEKLRRLIEKNKHAELPRITVSFGVAEFRGGGGDIKTLVSRADSALYAAKQNGRNRVELSA